MNTPWWLTTLNPKSFLLIIEPCFVSLNRIGLTKVSSISPMQFKNSSFFQTFELWANKFDHMMLLAQFHMNVLNMATLLRTRWKLEKHYAKPNFDKHLVQMWTSTIDVALLVIMVHKCCQLLQKKVCQWMS